MAITEEHIRFSIHFPLCFKKNATEDTAMICAAYVENAASYTIGNRWYQKLRQGDFNLEDVQRSGRSHRIEMDEMQALLDINSAQTEKELAEQLGVTQQAISVCLHTMRKVQREGRWIPHELSEVIKNRRRDTEYTLLSKFRKKRFFAQNNYRR